MSQESHITSPPDSGRSKRSHEASQSVAFANSIPGSANPSLMSTPDTPLSHLSAQESAILKIQETIVARQNELDKINMELSEIRVELRNMDGVGMEEAIGDLRLHKRTLLTRLTQVGAEIQSLRELELRKTPHVVGTTSTAGESAAMQRDPRPRSPWQLVSISELPEKIIEELNKPEPQVLEKCDENVPRGYVKFSFPDSVVGISPCLVSDRIMEDVRMIDPKMLVPVDQVEVLLESGRCVALIGVSGCGKTRTCFDLCRSGRWYGLYFDWSSHMDLAYFKKELEWITTKYRIQDYDKFVERSETVIKKILICRLLVLQLLIFKNGGTYSQKQFLLLQQWATTRENLFVLIARVLTRNQETHDIDAINQLYRDLLAWSRMHKICCIFDEAQVMFTCQKDCYSSCTNKSKAEDGAFVEPRSFLILTALFVLREKIRTVWSGTHLRLGDVSRLASAAGDKPEQSPRVFKDFNFLTPHVIKQLLDKWLRTDSEPLKMSISRKLAGRPRFLCSFIEKMHDSVVFISDEHLALLFANFYESISKSSGFANSMMNYIIACEKKTIKEFAPANEGD